MIWREKSRNVLLFASKIKHEVHRSLSLPLSLARIWHKSLLFISFVRPRSVRRIAWRRRFPGMRHNLLPWFGMRRKERKKATFLRRRHFTGKYGGLLVVRSCLSTQKVISIHEMLVHHCSPLLQYKVLAGPDMWKTTFVIRWNAFMVPTFAEMLEPRGGRRVDD